MSAKPPRTPQRAITRMGHFEPLTESAADAKTQLSLSYDWFRAAVTSERTMRAAARELARLAKRADMQAAAAASRESGGV